MKKQMMIVAMMTVMSTLASAGTKVACSVSTQSKPGEFDKPLYTGVVELESDSAPTFLYQLSSGESVYAAMTDRGNLTAGIARIFTHPTGSDAIIAVGSKKEITLLSFRHDVAVGCAQIPTR
ncbi:MAG: hypothetical protein KF865_13120 [Bdellovibrionaceae bacterium]|nr:hypothetical protein [Pseudobdellovibrionaceae bacterium]